MNFTVLHFDSLGSTNDEAVRQAKLGAAEGLCIRARAQTAGRGRRERVWHSPVDAGLYLSVVLRPRFAQQNWSLITLAAAIAVHAAIRESCNLAVDIKWSNDIHTLAGKKLAGILAETVETPHGSAVVLGIGINLRKTAIAPELSETAAALETEIGAAPNVEKLFESLVYHLRIVYATLHESGGTEKIVQEWTRRSSYASNKLVRVMLDNQTLTGVTRGLETSGALRVETETGTIKIVYAGDVIALRPEQLQI